MGRSQERSTERRKRHDDDTRWSQEQGQGNHSHHGGGDALDNVAADIRIFACQNEFESTERL
jgi:hypothetical protein